MDHPHGKPTYLHDCLSKQCIFLGSLYDDGSYYDLYFNNHGPDLPGIIVRCSSEGSDYFSYPLNIALFHGLRGNRSCHIAIQRIVSMGHMTEKLAFDMVANQ